MTPMSGIELISAIRENKKANRLPIIAMSGAGECESGGRRCFCPEAVLDGCTQVEGCSTLGPCLALDIEQGRESLRAIVIIWVEGLS